MLALRDSPVFIDSWDVLAQQIGALDASAQRGWDALNINSLQLIKPAPRQHVMLHDM